MRYGLLRNDGPAPRSNGHEGYLAGLHSTWNWREPLKDLTSTERSLAIVGAVNLVYVFLQLGAASATGSLAMLSDAFHNLSDVGAAVIAFQAERFRKRLAPDGMPFGYLRVQVLGALVNAVCLVSLAGYLILAALPALIAAAEAETDFQPTPLYLTVASIGVVLNLGSAGLLICGGKDEHGNPIHVHAHAGCECGTLHNNNDHSSSSQSRTEEAAPSFNGSKHRNSDPSNPPPSFSGNATASAAAPPCLDACCAPVQSLDAAALEVPFAFAAKRPRRGRPSSASILAPSPTPSSPSPSPSTLELPTTVAAASAPTSTANVLSKTPTETHGQQKARIGESGLGQESGDVEAPNPSSVELVAAVKKDPTLALSAPLPVKINSTPPPTPTQTPAVFPLKVFGSRVVHNCLKCGELVWKRKPIDENVLAVAVHSAGDAASSLAVLTVGLLVLLVEEDSSNVENSSDMSSSSDSNANSSSTKWTAFLDPLVTIVLALAMARAMRGVLTRSMAILLETSPLSMQEVAKLTSTLNQDPLMRAAHLEVASAVNSPSSASASSPSLAASENSGSNDREPTNYNNNEDWPRAAIVVTALDFSESNRRATVRLRRRRIDDTSTPPITVEKLAPGLGSSEDSLLQPSEQGSRRALLPRVKKLLSEHGGVRWATVEIDVS